MAELSHQSELEPASSVEDGLLRAFPILAHANAANAITSTSIALGIGASLLVIEGYLLPALMLGPLTIICDTLDGYVARRTKSSSEFGAQLDSFADAISFGVLPAMLGYGLGMKGLLEIFLVWFVLGSVWRLARFGLVGLRTNASGRECFEGMPTTLMASLFYILVPIVLRLPNFAGTALLAAFFVTGPLLMNSSLLIPKRGLGFKLLLPLGPISMYATWVYFM